MIKKYLFFLLGVLLLHRDVNGQAQNTSIQPVNQPTANAEALGKYGLYPVNLYTGQVNISIPLYNIGYGGIQIPIALNYDASGIKVDQHPTWTGLGFNLLAGGAITRSVAGMPDDYFFPDQDDNIYLGTEKGYLYSHSKMDYPDGDWNALSRLLTYAFPSEPGVSTYNPSFLADGTPDDFAFSFGNYSGSFFMDEKGIWRIKSKDNLSLEILHEVNTDPVSIQDCYNNQTPKKLKVPKMITKFTIITPDGFRYTFGGNMNAIEFSRSAQDVFRYNDHNPDLFNVSPAAWYLTEIESPALEKVTFTYDRGLNLIRHTRGVNKYHIETNATLESGNNKEVIFSSILTPCYLKEIESPFVKLEFSRSYSVEQIIDPTFITWKVGSTSYSLAAYEKQMYNATMNIGSGNTPRSWPDFWCNEYLNGQNERPLSTSGYSNQTIPDWSFKLDGFLVRDKQSNEVIQRVQFGYSNTTSKRLMLYNISITPEGEAPRQYSFDYYSDDLVPNYAWFTKDQWGYNNGQNYTSAGSAMYNAATWRMASLENTLYGTLKKITYPTGGTTDFEYELNGYSRYQKVTPSDNLALAGTVSLESTGNKNAGGLRIKKVTSSAGYNSPPVTKEYFYVSDYLHNGNISSGTLSGLNVYQERVDYTEDCYAEQVSHTSYSDNAFPRWGEKDIKTVGYSEVTEKSGDGSFKVYKYSSYGSPGGLDEYHLPPAVDGNAVSFSDMYQLTSNELERGLLLSEEAYDAGSAKVWEKLYEYDFAVGRKSLYAKCITRKDMFKQEMIRFFERNEPCVHTDLRRLYPFKKYYYHLPLIKTQEKTYQEDGAITQETSFTYDEYGNRTLVVANTSDGQQLLQQVRFNSHPDYLSGSATSPEALGVRRLSSQYHIRNYPVEELTMLRPAPVGGSLQVAGEKITSGNLYAYYHDKPVLSKVYALELDAPFYPATFNSGTQQLDYHFTPSAVTGGSFVFDSRYKLQSIYNDYTAYPPGIGYKPLGAINNTILEAYTWDYKGQIMSSRCRNAAAGETAFSSFEGSYAPEGSADDCKGNWDINPDKIVTEGFTGKKSYILSSPDFIGNNFSLAAGKRYCVSFWLKSANPRIKLGSIILPQSYTPKKQSGDWKYYEISVTGNGAPVYVGIEGSGLGDKRLDELRLYPEGARMDSYTYDPARKTVTSIADENGRVSFYLYDNSGNLVVIKDEQGYILQKFTYTIQGQ